MGKNDNTIFSIEIEGSPELDVVTVSNVLTSITRMLAEINTELGTSGVVKFISKPESSNTFNLKMAPRQTEGLFRHVDEPLVFAPALATLVGALEKLGQMDSSSALNAENTSDGSVAVINQLGKRVEFAPLEYRLVFENSTFQSALQVLLRAVRNDPMVTGVSFLVAGSEQHWKLTRENSELIPTNDLAPKRIQRRKVVIHLIKLAFERNLTWDFLYRGEKKSAYIKDLEFWEAVQSGEITFDLGVEMRVEIEIEQRFGSKQGIYVDTENLAVTKVFDVIKPNAQPDLYGDLIPERKNRKLTTKLFEMYRKRSL